MPERMLDGNFGYWAEDEEDGAEGFLDALEEVFWIWDDNDYAWFQRRFQGRRTRKGKGKVEKEKEKEDQDEDFSDQETKEQEKEREKEKVILLKMKVIGLKMNGKEMRMRIGMKAIGPMKVKLHGNPQAGMNGKEITMMSMDTSKEKERKERKEKQKERKVMDLKIKEKDKVMGTVKPLCEPSHPSQPSSQQEALPSAPVYLTSVKKTESGEQKMGPDFSCCAFRQTLSLILWQICSRDKIKAIRFGESGKRSRCCCLWVLMASS